MHWPTPPTRTTRPRSSCSIRSWSGGIALIQHRLGVAAALRLAESRGFQVEWVDAARHGEATSALSARRRRRVSFVDLVSFAVMRARGIEMAFAFDADFVAEGFKIVSAP